MIERAVALCRDKEIELVASIGGGSALDTAKLVAYLAKTPDRLDDIYGVGLAKGERLPLLAGADDRRHRLGGDADRDRHDADDGKEGRRFAAFAAGLGDPRSGTDAGLARARHGRNRHRRHGARDRSLYQPAQEESDVGSAGATGARLAVGECSHGLRRRLESRSAIANAARLDAGRDGIRQFAGRRGPCAGLSDRRDIPRAAWFVERAGPDAGAAVQFAGGGRRSMPNWRRSSIPRSRE